MLIILLVVLFYLSHSVLAYAQVPLYYQLLQAYHPSTVSYLISTTPSSPTVLGTSTTSSPLPAPTPSLSITPTPLPNVGGENPIVTIAVLGDSMIDTLGPGLPKLLSSLKLYYPNRQFQILNYGFGSSNLEHGLYRLTNDHNYLGQPIPSLLSQKPDIIIIESFAYNNFGNSQSGIDRQWLTLGAITTTIKDKLPQSKIIMAATIAPNSVIFGNGIANTHFTAMEKMEKTNTIKLYLQNLVNFATSQGFPLADAYHLSLDGSEGQKDLINSTDNLHPSDSGNQFFCDTIAKAIFDNKIIEQ